MTDFALIAFDLDGTLADTERLSLPDAIVMLNEDYNVPVTLDYWFANYHGLAGQTLLDRIAADFSVTIPLDGFLAARAARIPGLFAGGVPAAPGMLQAVRQLVAGGQQLCICSNSQAERIQLTLRHLTGQHAAGINMEQVFEGHMFAGVGSNLRPKPEPDVYAAAAARYGANPALCLAVEDSATGAKSAHAAGFTCIGYLGLAHDAEKEEAKLKAAGVKAIFRHWDEFLPLLATL